MSDAPETIDDGADAPGSSSTETPSARPRRGLRALAWTGATVGVLALAGGGLVAAESAGLFDPPMCSELDQEPESIADSAELGEARVVCTHDEFGYDVTAGAEGIADASLQVTVPARVAYAQAADGLAVYADAALTIEVPTTVADGDDAWVVASAEPAQIASADGSETIGLGAESGAWSLRDEYYLVRSVDGRGRALDRPVVTTFSFERGLGTPDVVAASGPDTRGVLALQWQPVEGAASYAIVRIDGGQYDLVGTTQETEWTSAAAPAADAGEADGIFAEAVNSGIAGGSADYTIGVIAVGEDAGASPAASSMLDLAPTGVLATTPVAIVDGTIETSTPMGLAEVPREIEVTALDGSVALLTPVLAPGTIERVDADHISVGLFVAGTDLGARVTLSLGSSGSLITQIESYNDAVEIVAEDSDAAEAAMETTLADHPLTGAAIEATAPVVDYPVVGSDPMVRYMAAHLIARSPQVDWSVWRDLEGSPALEDAVFEAMHQNPYAYLTEFEWTDRIVYFTYDYDPTEYATHQEELHAAVVAAVAEAVPAGASPARAATAINDWIVTKTDYNDPAYEVSVSVDDPYEWWPAVSAAGYAYAWEANGVFEGLDVVCEGYATAFQAMALESGLDVVYVTGSIDDSGERHAWNKVRYSGSWHNVDPTWNDTPWAPQYLLIPDSGFTGSAERTEDEYWIVDGNAGRYTAG